MDQETKNPCNLTPEEQEQLRAILTKTLNFRGRKLFNSISGDLLEVSGTQTTGRLIKWSNGTSRVLTDSHLSDIASNLVKGDLLYASANDILNKLAIGALSQELRVNNGLPEWFTPTTNVSPYVPDSAAKGFVLGGFIGTVAVAGLPFAFPGLAGAPVYQPYPSSGWIRNLFTRIRAATGIGDAGITFVQGQNFAVGGLALGFFPIQAISTISNTKEFQWIDLFDSLGYTKVQASTPISCWSVEFVTSDASCFIATIVPSSGAGQQIAASTTKFIPFFAPNTTAAVLLKTNETDAFFICPTAGTIASLLTQFATAQSATGTLVLTIRKNGVDQTLTITVPAGDASGMRYSDTTHTFTVVAGDTISIKAVNNATVASTRICVVFVKFTSNTGSYYIGGSCIDAPSLASPVTYYFAPFCGSQATNHPSTTETNVTFPMARAGTLQNFYAYIQTDGGGTLTIFKNGVATSLVITLGGGTGVKSDTTHTVSVAQGDLISLEINSTSGTPVITSWSAEFV